MNKRDDASPFQRVAPAGNRGSYSLPGAAQRVAPAEAALVELPDRLERMVIEGRCGYGRGMFELLRAIIDVKIRGAMTALVAFQKRLDRIENRRAAGGSGRHEPRRD